MKLFFLNFIYSFNDMPYNWQYRLQDPATPIAESMLAFHNYIMFFLILIFFFVLWMLFASLFFFKNNKRPYQFVHSSDLEAIWTIIPAIILVLIAVPSFSLLFSLEQRIKPAFTLKVIGHQWYWTYQMGGLWKYVCYATKLPDLEYKENEFECYLKPVEDFRRKGLVRLLDTDVRLVLPKKVYIKVLVTSVDVLHSWAVPSFGIKIDACPGRLNQVSLYIQRSGLYYGQCSEICGVNHAFMPISIKVVSFKKFLLWYQFFIDNSQDFLVNISEKPFQSVNNVMNAINRTFENKQENTVVTSLSKENFSDHVFFDLGTKRPVFAIYNSTKKLNNVIYEFLLKSEPLTGEMYYNESHIFNLVQKMLEINDQKSFGYYSELENPFLAVSDVNEEIVNSNIEEAAIVSIEEESTLVNSNIEESVVVSTEEKIEELSTSINSNIEESAVVSTEEESILVNSNIEESVVVSTEEEIEELSTSNNSNIEESEVVLTEERLIKLYKEMQKASEKYIESNQSEKKD